MTFSMKSRLNKDAVSAFYMGKTYPLIISLLTAIGSIFNIEFYFAILHIALAIGAFLLSKSIRPLFISFITFVMQISIKHAPAYPTHSKYYYTGWRLPVFIAMVALVVCAIIFFIVKNKIYRKISFKSTPLLLPLILLSTAFLLNGLFSEKWVFQNLLWALLNIFVFLVIFILFYHGLSDEDSAESLADYFSYISALVALIIISEVSALYLSGKVIIDGTVIKENVALGWGIWNLIGVSLAVLIPMLFYGVHNSKYPWFYFAVATLTYIFAILSMSRNALLASSIVYPVCVIISCFKGKNKKAFRVVTLLGIIAVIAFAIIFREKIYTILLDYFERGFSDNKRFELWGAAYDNFLKSPMFGNGFMGFDVSDELLYSFGLQGKQAHNTILQLLSATGIVGLFAYLYYRYHTLKPVFRRPSLKKTLVLLSILVLLFESLLDNFIFNVYPMFYYTVALVILHKFSEEERQ